MLKRKCPKCQIVKDIEQFSIDVSRKGGRQCYCRECQAKIYESKKAIAKEQRKKRYLENKERETQKMRDYYDANKSDYYARNAIRRSMRISASPSWLTPEDKEAMASLYAQAQQLSASTEEVWHVDHVVPLQGKTVCGLHVPWNLQVITATENLAKNNRFVE